MLVRRGRHRRPTVGTARQRSAGDNGVVGCAHPTESIRSGAANWKTGGFPLRAEEVEVEQLLKKVVVQVEPIGIYHCAVEGFVHLTETWEPAPS
jgi:hypothetical protein